MTGTPEDKFVIKLHRTYNKNSKTGAINQELFQINDLTDNTEFEKIIEFPQEVEVKTEENE